MRVLQKAKGRTQMIKIKRLRPGQGCEHPDCTKPATGLVKDVDPETGEDIVLAVCDKHDNAILDARAPEYIVTCPNCDCRIPVG